MYETYEINNHSFRGQCLCSILADMFPSFLFGAFIISNFGFGTTYKEQTEKSIMSGKIGVKELLDNGKSGGTATRCGNGSMGANGDGH